MRLVTYATQLFGAWLYSFENEIWIVDGQEKMSTYVDISAI